MTTATAIANHLNIVESAIAQVEEWASVLFVRFVKGSPRFVSKKVKEQEMKLPELKGSEKQVKWATDLRNEFIELSQQLKNEAEKEGRKQIIEDRDVKRLEKRGKQEEANELKTEIQQEVETHLNDGEEYYHEIINIRSASKWINCRYEINQMKEKVRVNHITSSSDLPATIGGILKIMQTNN